MTEPTGRPRPTRYQKLPETVWETIRRHYIRGHAVPYLAERFGVGEAVIYWRARRHGWQEAREDVAAAVIDRAFTDEPPTPWSFAPREGEHRAPPEPRELSVLPPPPPELAGHRPVEAADILPETPAEAAEYAFRRASAAMAENSPAMAQSWMRLARQMQQVDDDHARDVAAAPADLPVEWSQEKRNWVATNLSNQEREHLAAGFAKARDPGFYPEDLTDAEAKAAGRAHFRPGGDPDPAPGHQDDGLDFLRYYRPGKGTQWERVTAFCARRLDMLMRDWFLGGWDPQVGRPAWVWNPQTRTIVHSSTLPEDSVWLTPDADELAMRERFDRPLPPVSTLRPPPLRWITDVWLPTWNEEHPDKPCTPLQAMTIHQLFTRDPRLEAVLIPEEQFHSRILWEEKWAREGVEPVRYRDPSDDNAERTEAERRRVWAEVTAAKDALLAQERAEAGEEGPEYVKTEGGFRVRVL